MTNYIIEKTHISNINVGDTIMHYGEMKTISGNNLKRDSFMGTTLFGDSYNIGHKLIDRIIFTKN
jgi:hypothetical protein